jgi:phosphatidylserine decarboxylase
MSIKEKLVLSMGLLPQNTISYLVGTAVRVRLPKMLQAPVNRAFVSAFGLNMAEAAKALPDYGSIEEIFTRTLKPNERKISGHYVASADGVLEMSRPSSSGAEAVQAKGLSYSLSELVTGDRSQDIGARWFSTIYLAPHNYHRVHAPVSGKVVAIRYIPGRLWPVNRPAVKAVANLFCRNERLVFDFELSGGAKAWVVMVGAFNVGRMATGLDPEFVTNAIGRQMPRDHKPSAKRFDEPVSVAAGDELGVFMLGSTTVVVLDELARQQLSPREILSPMTIMMGQNLSQQASQ